jgi:hypothetical protein
MRMGCGFGGGAHHGGSACGVDGEEGGSSLGGGADGSGYSVGDVVELEVEEDVEAAVAELLDEDVAGGVVEFYANLEPLDRGAEGVYECEGLLGVGIVKGYGEAGFGIHDFSLAFLLGCVGC